MRRNVLTSTLLLTAILARRDALTGEGDPKTDPPSGDPPKLSEAEWEAKRQAELSKRSVDQLVTRQIDLERDVRKLRAQVPTEGSVVLTADEAKEWDAYKGFGPSKDLKTRLENGDKAVTTLAGRERGDQLREVADAAGYKLSVFQKLADQDNLTFEIGAEVEKDGKKTRPVTVKTQDGKSNALSEYATANWADFETSLQAGTTTKTTTERKVVTGGNTDTTKVITSDDVLSSKRNDTRYSM